MRQLQLQTQIVLLHDGGGVAAASAFGIKLAGWAGCADQLQLQTRVVPHQVVPGGTISKLIKTRSFL